MSFLPEGYEIPETSNYMKFEEGENRFRILAGFNQTKKAIMGVEYWVTKDDGKRYPKRLKPGIPVPVEELELNPKTGEVDIPKHFWAMPVYNYNAKKIQILEITQKSIQQGIMSLSNNPKWGDPLAYDIVVTQTKEGGKTSYSVTPDPKEEVSEDIAKMYKSMYLNTAALFDGGDPFVNKDGEGLSKEETEEIEQMPF